MKKQEIKDLLIFSLLLCVVIFSPAQYKKELKNKEILTAPNIKYQIELNL